MTLKERFEQEDREREALYQELEREQIKSMKYMAIIAIMMEIAIQLIF